MKKLHILLFFQLVIFSIGTALAQDKEQKEISEFLIVVEAEKGSIKLTSNRGCAWKELTFTTKPDKPQAINQYGMTSLDEKNEDKDQKLADFLFTITVSNDGLVLKGFEGTVWTTLTGNCGSPSCKSTIDQNGITVNR